MPEGVTIMKKTFSLVLFFLIFLLFYPHAYFSASADRYSRPHSGAGAHIRDIRNDQYLRSISFTLAFASRDIPFNFSAIVFCSDWMNGSGDELVQEIRYDIRNYRGHRRLNYGYMDDRIMIVADLNIDFITILYDETNPLLSGINFEEIASLLLTHENRDKGLGAVVIALIHEIYERGGYEIPELLAIRLRILEEPHVIEHYLNFMSMEGVLLLGGIYDESTETIIDAINRMLEQRWPFQEMPEIAKYNERIMDSIRRIPRWPWPFEEMPEITDEHIAAIREGRLTEPALLAEQQDNNRHIYFVVGSLLLAVPSVLVFVKLKSGKKLT